MDIKEIQNLIKFVAKSGASEVKLEMEDVKITIRTGAGKTETTILQAAPVSGECHKLQLLLRHKTPPAEAAATASRK